MTTMYKPRAEIAQNGSRNVSTIPNYHSDGIMNMIGTALKAARTDPDYLRGPCGRYLAELVGLEPEVVYRMAVKCTPREGEQYTPLEQCPSHEHNVVHKNGKSPNLPTI